MKPGFLRAGLAVAIALGGAALGWAADANASDASPAETAQKLASEMKMKLSALGENASARQDADALTTLVTNARVSCSVAKYAVRIARSSTTASSASNALAQLNARLRDGKNEDCKSWYPPPGSSSGGLSAAAGAPPAYFGGGGSNYLTH